MYYSDRQISPSQNKRRRPIPRIFSTQFSEQTESLGQFKATILSGADNRPLSDALIFISHHEEGGPTIEELNTDSAGSTRTISLPAPPLDYSLDPEAGQPYSEYTLTITAPGHVPRVIDGVQIFPTVTALQNIVLTPLSADHTGTTEIYTIPPHVLFGDYPPKIAENEVKSLEETGDIIMEPVIIPEFIIVHDGTPSDASAKNHLVSYRDYIKNVASCQVYPTWPISAIYANILAIQSFTLNRIYTDWYAGKGHHFTITSSSAYDHKWMPERTIYDTINTAVDAVFSSFLSRPGISQPILTGYCDGRKVTCPGLMSQWDSKSLADQGLTASRILKDFYGDSIYINESAAISGVPSSYPGYSLNTGDQGPKVRRLQEQLNAIADVYSPIPKIATDGIIGPDTAAAVIAFQKQFDLPQTGITDFATWYKISAVFVAISRTIL